MGSITLDDLMTYTKSFQAGASDTMNKMNALTQTQADLASANKDIATQSASDSSVVSAASNASILTTQAKNQLASTTFGTDIGGVTDQITQLAQVSKDAYDQKQKALEAINEKSQVSLFDNPIQYLMNQFTINSDIAQHNSANELQQSAEDRIKALNADTQTQAITNNATAAPLTTAAADAANRLAASKAATAANQFAIDNATYSLQGLQNIQNMNKEQLNNNFSLFNAAKAQEAAETSLAHLDLARKQFDIADQVRKDTQGYGEQLLKEVNAGRISRGVSPLPDNVARGLVAAARSKLPISVEYQNDAMAGQVSLSSDNPAIATSPGHLLDRLQMGTRIVLTPGQEIVKNVVTEARDTVNFAAANPQNKDVQNDPILKNVDFSKKENADGAINKIAQLKINAMATEVTPGDPKNVFNVGSINNIAASSPVVQALPIYQKVLKPVMDSGKVISSFDEAFTMAVKAVNNGTITQNELLDLSTIAQVGSANNIVARNLQGVAGLVPSRLLNTRITTGVDSIFGKATEVVNVNDRQKLSTAANKASASALSEAIRLNLHYNLLE